MIKLLKISNLLIIMTLVAGLWSCNDDTEEEFEVTGDVVTLKRDFNDTIKYALAYYAYGNKKMSSAKATTPDGDNITLKGDYSESYTFYSEPDSADYSTSLPEFGTYNFTVVNDGTEYFDSDSHLLSNVDIPTIDSLAWSVSNTVVYVAWDNNKDADGFVVRIFDENRNPVFVSYLAPSTAVLYECYSATGSMNTAGFVQGKTYTVEVQAMVFEDAATNANYYYNIETIAIASESFVWE